MLYFRNDYGCGAHPAVLEALCATNDVLTPGYGTDPYCHQAAETVRTLCQSPQAAVHFLAGGTQVNKTAIYAFLRPHGPGFVYADVAAPGGYGRLIGAEECVDSGLIYLGSTGKHEVLLFL